MDLGELVFEVPAPFDGCTANDFLRRGKGVSSRLIKTLKKLDPPWGLLRGENLLRTIDLVMGWRSDHPALAGEGNNGCPTGSTSSGVV